MNTASEGIFDSSGSRAEALADHIKVARNDLGETLSPEEGQVEKMISERPIASLASQVTGMIHHPLNGILPLLIVPLITIIISLKKPAASPGGGAAAPDSK